jgi:hypothetical protein
MCKAVHIAEALLSDHMLFFELYSLDNDSENIEHQQRGPSETSTRIENSIMAGSTRTPSLRRTRAARAVTF